MGRLFRRLFVLAAVTGAVAWVAHKLGLAGHRDDDDPFEYAPAPMSEDPMPDAPMPSGTPMPEAAPAAADASADDGEQQAAGE